jgi:hypothetical protein
VQILDAIEQGEATPQELSRKVPRSLHFTDEAYLAAQQEAKRRHMSISKTAEVLLYWAIDKASNTHD